MFHFLDYSLILEMFFFYIRGQDENQEQDSDLGKPWVLVFS